MRIQNHPAKHIDRSFFLALQADAKDYPGGIYEFGATAAQVESDLKFMGMK